MASEPIIIDERFQRQSAGGKGGYVSGLADRLYRRGGGDHAPVFSIRRIARCRQGNLVRGQSQLNREQKRVTLCSIA